MQYTKYSHLFFFVGSAYTKSQIYKITKVVNFTEQ